MKNKQIARVRDLDKESQSLSEHLSGTAKLAEEYAEKIGLAKIGKIMGLLHDMGKAIEEFQRSPLMLKLHPFYSLTVKKAEKQQSLSQDWTFGTKTGHLAYLVYLNQQKIGILI